MDKIIIKYLFFCVAFSCLSCKSNFDFLNKYNEKTTPITNTLNFNNYLAKNLLNKKQLKKLQIHKIISKKNAFKKTTKVGVLYKPLLSENFKSIIIHINFNNTELNSILINYTKKNKLIDYKIVSLDERSDFILKTTSIIYKNKILLNEYNFLTSKKPKKLHFKILPKGKIIRE